MSSDEKRGAGEWLRQHGTAGPRRKPTQAQILASWRSLLGGALVLLRGGANEQAMGRRHVDQVACEIYLAQIMGLPCDESAHDEPPAVPHPTAPDHD